MAFALFRRWAFTAMTAFAIVLYLLFTRCIPSLSRGYQARRTCFFHSLFLSSLWFAQSYAETNKNFYLFLAILLYAAALGAKEIGIICLPIYYLVFIGAQNKKKKRIDAQTPLLAFATIAIVYFLMRWAY